MKFSNCGQTCGQRRFLTSYRRGGKCCQPNSPKAFRVFRGLRPEPGLHALKASALPTALHPVMKFSNCGQTCGQRRFLTSYRRGGKCCQPNCPKAFRVFRGLRLEPEPHAPKLRAVLFRKILPAFRSLHRVPDGRLCPSLFYRNILQSQGEPFQQLLPRLRLRRSPGRAPAE